MRRGFRFINSFGASPSFSRTPGRKGSRKMSAVDNRESRIALDVGDFKSRMIDDFRRERLSLGPKKLPGRSIRTTLAPKSDRRSLC